MKDELTYTNKPLGKQVRPLAETFNGFAMLRAIFARHRIAALSEETRDGQ